MSTIFAQVSGGGWLTQYNLGLGDELIVAPDVVRYSFAIVADGDGENDVFVGRGAALIATGGNRAISLGMRNPEVGNNTVIAAEGSSIVAQEHAIQVGGNDNILNLNGEVQSDAAAILAAGERNDLSNTGVIQAGIGVRIGQDGVVTNFGIIDAVTAAVRTTENGHEIVNHGDIQSSGFAFEMIFAATDTDLDDNRIVNRGTITARDTVINYQTNGALVVINSGLMQTIEGAAIDIDTAAGASGSTVTNTGTIIGGSGVAFNGSNGVDTIRNEGLIEGAINLRDGDDIYDGRGGTVNGGVAGGAGNDTYIVDDGNTVVIELENEGTDEVIFTGTGGFSLEGQEHVELLTAQTAGNVTLVGHEAVNEICGGSGDDILRGLGGDDTLYGKAGNDALYGGFGNDELQGDSGDDFISGGGDDDIMRGVDGRDTLIGGEGNDQMFGGLDDDSLDGGQGDDTMFGGTGDDDMFGGAGDDELRGQSDDDTILGNSGSDLIDGGSGDDTINGGTAHDDLTGGTGEDTITGGAGDDLIRGNADNDVLRGSSGDDTIGGDGGNDTLEGQSGDDDLDGGVGDDTLDGGFGNDRIYGGGGSDTYTGGEGADTFVFQSGDGGADTVLDFETGDTVELSGYGYASVAEAQADFSVVDGAVVFQNGSSQVTFEGDDPAQLLADIQASVSIGASVFAAPALEFGGIESGARVAPALDGGTASVGSLAAVTPAAEILNDVAELFADPLDDVVF